MASDLKPVPVAVKLAPELKARLTRLAQSRQRSAHWLMRAAIEEYLDREEKREALRQACLQAWEHYQATGKHVSAAEADAWLAKLEAGEDAEPPASHD